LKKYYKYRKQYLSSSKRPTKAATRNAEFLHLLFLTGIMKKESHRKDNILCEVRRK
jgi:hypothetical protein